MCRIRGVHGVFTALRPLGVEMMRKILLGEGYLWGIWRGETFAGAQMHIAQRHGFYDELQYGPGYASRIPVLRQIECQFYVGACKSNVSFTGTRRGLLLEHTFDTHKTETFPRSNTYPPPPPPRSPRAARVQLAPRPMHSNISSNLTPRASFVPCNVSIEHVFECSSRRYLAPRTPRASLGCTCVLPRYAHAAYLSNVCTPPNGG